MGLRSDSRRYGWVAIALHWAMAAAIVGLFGLGLWMTGLDYYSPWYQKAPWLHKSVGILVLLVLLLRVLWRVLDRPPAPLGEPGSGMVYAARLAHASLYLLILAVAISGYLISTADGRAIEVFTWFDVPATLHGYANQEDLAGELHEWLAWGLIALSVLHALAALKHHFIDRDRTLIRMFGR
ncbi:MAG: cytochrome b [Chromatiales bacterium]|nr:cytochrome b [Chromatiales bacterium]